MSDTTSKLQQIRHYLGVGALAALVIGIAPTAMARDGLSILNAKCKSCHLPDDKTPLTADKKLVRISDQRKTPEGWLANIGRMQVMWGVKITDQDRRDLVKYLADKQGLAPSETEGFRYAMERRLNTTSENFEPLFAEMCARCHSGARFALQRKPAEEWSRLVHFHLGRFPSLEYQMMGRDRDWFGIALKEVVPALAKAYPLESQAWSDWQKQRPAANTLAGEWSFSGHLPGKGDVAGVMTVKNTENDQFKVEVKGQYADGGAFNGEGSAVLYNGYEWRGNIKMGNDTLRQVFAAVNGEMRGRMFDKTHDERGLDFAAAQKGAAPRLLAVQPGYIKAGQEAEVSIIGSGLTGAPSFGNGVQVVAVVAQTPERLTVRVKAAADAADGLRAVSVGSISGGSLAVFKNVAEVKVVPAFSVARIGGNGGATPKMEGRFDAEGWGQGADGKPFRIGVFPAKWSVEPFNDQAKEDQDLKFAGVMDAASGIFTPGDAGPNPARKMSTNNTGNLKVVANVNAAGQALKGEAQLIVTVQRWNNPPLP
ncbi:MAG: quinohemoprotein amine dehydrogenase subunit alpha [Azonexus sp.]|jgi:quinohemoprotein amine dehydrogenase alpha subunit|nr:quinohemoprotein amine dehydrogenase subunit alpha [Azonexus sp.]